MFKFVLKPSQPTPIGDHPLTDTLFLHIAWKYKPLQPIGGHPLWPCPLRVVSNFVRHSHTQIYIYIYIRVLAPCASHCGFPRTISPPTCMIGGVLNLYDCIYRLYSKYNMKMKCWQRSEKKASTLGIHPMKACTPLSAASSCISSLSRAGFVWGRISSAFLVTFSVDLAISGYAFSPRRGISECKRA